MSQTAADWVEKNTGLTLTGGQQRCMAALAATASNGQIYNVPLVGQWTDAVPYSLDEGHEDDNGDPVELAPVVFHEQFVIARLKGELATYDGDALTRLVLAAHDHAVRVSVSAVRHLDVYRDSYLWEWKYDPDSRRSGKWVETDKHPTSVGACLEVMLHPRTREGTSRAARHPTIEEALRHHRQETP